MNEYADNNIFIFFFLNQDNNILIYWRKSDVNIIKVEILMINM